MLKEYLSIRRRNSEIKKSNLEKQNKAAKLQAKLNAMPLSQAFIESKNHLSDHTVIFCAKRGVLVSPKNLEESESVVSFLANGVSGLVDKTLMNPVRNLKASVVSAFKSKGQAYVRSNFSSPRFYSTSVSFDSNYQTRSSFEFFESHRVNNLG